VSGGQGSQPQAAKLERHAVRHFPHSVMSTQAMPVEACGGGGGKRQLMPSDVIRVGMRHEAPRLAAAHVDRELRERQE
jgi:hypothetical protein